MGILLALVLGQQVRHWNLVKVDSDRAIQLGTRAAANVGLKDLQVTAFTLVDNDAESGCPYWSVALGPKNQRKATCRTRIDARNGHLLWLDIGIWDQHSTYTDNGKRHPDQTRVEDIAWKAIRKLAAEPNLRLLRAAPAKPQSSAEFDLLVDGKRFFNFNPRLGYTVSFDFASGQVQWFTANEVRPTIASQSAAVNKADAKQNAEKWIQKQPQFARCKQVMGDLGPPKLTTELEDGYFKFGKETKARRVWLATSKVYRQDPRNGPFLFSSYHCLVDQASGEAFPYKDREAVIE